MIPATYNLPDAYRGDNYGPIYFFFTYANGSPINLNGCTAASQVKNSKNSVFLEWNTSDNSITVSGNAVILNTKQGDSMRLPANTYFYDLQLTSGTRIKTYVQGQFTVYPDVTEL
jgi:hypothetical protein